jgi:hypothetical protein
VGLHGGRRRPKRDVTLNNERQTWRNHIQPRLGSRPFTEIRRLPASCGSGLRGARRADRGQSRARSGPAARADSS